MQAMDAILQRKSVRQYLGKAVEDDKIKALLEAANSAPLAGEFHITVLKNSALIKEINDKAHIAMKNSGNDFLMERAALPGYQPLYGAPLLLVFSAAKANPYSLANVSNACTTAAIAATALGLGSCYVVTPTMALGAEPELAGKIGVPKGLTPMCALLVGYSGKDQFASPKQAANNVNYCQ